MYVSACSRSFAPMPFFEACSPMTDCGFDRVEIWLDEAGKHLSVDEVTADPEAFAKRFRESTRLTPIAFLAGFEISADQLAGLIQTAKAMRVAQISVPSSPLGTPFNTEVDRLREYVAVARPDGVRVSITTVTGHLSEDPHTAVELCQAVPGLGITLDPSHFICGPHSGVSFDQVFPHVFHTHLRDTTPKELQVPVGRGEVDYSRLITQLQRENYKQALSVDIDPQGLDNETLTLELRKLRMLLDSLL